MKKTIIVAALALLSSVAVSAQERMSAEQREKAIAERIGSAADRMAKDFDLKDDAKKSFVETYTAYQKEMFAREERTDEGRSGSTHQAELRTPRAADCYDAEASGGSEEVCRRVWQSADSPASAEGAQSSARSARRSRPDASPR